MVPLWKWFCGLAVYFLLKSTHIDCQTTQSTTTTIATNTPEVTSTTTTFVPTLTPLLTTEGTTLATAGTAQSTTTISTEEATSESTTEGQASNEDVIRGGFGFESTRNRPNANQEVQPETETESATTVKPEEKKVAWKFGRGGNNQGPWASRPSPNGGFSVWKKEVPASNAEPADGDNSKQNDQGYLVWNVGQGNQPGGWTIGGNANSWAPAGWIPADASVENNPDTGGWNGGGWADEQSSENNGAQGGWSDDEVSPDEGVSAGWDNDEADAWNPPNQGTGGYDNGQSQAPAPNSQLPNAWQPQNNGNGGTWIANPQSNGGRRGKGSGWVSPKQKNRWVVQTQGNPTGSNKNGGSWNGAPGPSTADTWQNGGWNTEQQNTGGWDDEQQNTGGWNNGQQNAGGWNNGQQSEGGWNNGGGGPTSWQDTGLSWKIYNEDTKTMENLDDNSGWKVIGDGGADGWKLVDENGNVEWKIENINGEWKVTSADEFSNINNTTSVLGTNSTADVNDTSIEITTTASTPSGGWDDDKQGRYIIWKFSDDGKGEARVYNGPGSKPEVWTVGDNNQWWKETMGVKEADTVVQGGYNSGNNKWQSNGGWQNASPQSNDPWRNKANNAPSLTGNEGWQSDERSQNNGNGWRQNASPGNNGGASWQNNGPPAQNGGNTWQVRGSQKGTKLWQSKAGRTVPQKWNNGGPAAPPNTRRQRPPPNWKAGNSGLPATSGWQNSRPALQPQGGTWQKNPGNQQTGWKNGGAQNSGGWAKNGRTSAMRVKGRGRSNGNRSFNGRTSNNVNGGKSGVPKGTVWNSGNGWQTTPSLQRKVSGRGTNNLPASNGAMPVAINPSGIPLQNGGNQVSPEGVWPGKTGGGQIVPYVIILPSPGAGSVGSTSDTWKNDNNAAPISRKSGNTNNSGNRRNVKYRINRAGSGWQWNPEGGKDELQWRDGWMGSGGGFGGWMNDKGTMYSSWRPTKTTSAQARKSSVQRSGTDKGNKKSASKMVFVFGTKKKSGDNSSQSTNKQKKGKPVIIIDYTTGGKEPPNGDDSMKKDIESVIEALKTAKPTGIRGTVWKQPG